MRQIYDQQMMVSSEELAKRYVSYSLSHTDSDPYGLAANMMLVDAKLQHDDLTDDRKVRSFLANMPDQNAVLQHINDEYCQNFLNQVTDQYASAMQQKGQRVQYDALRDGCKADFLQTVQVMQSKYESQTPMQQMRDILRKTGVPKQDMLAVSGSLLQDMGISLQGDDLADECSFRVVTEKGTVDYALSDRQLRMTGADGVQHMLSDADTMMVLQKAGRDLSVGQAVSSVYDFEQARQNLLSVKQQGLSDDAADKEGAVHTQLHVSHNGQPVYYAESVYSLQDGAASVNALVKKNTSFFEENGKPLTDGALLSAKQDYRRRGYTGDTVLSKTDAAAELQRYGTGLQYVEQKDVCIGDTKFDMTALSDMFRQKGTMFLNQPSVSAQDVSASWRVTKTAGNQDLQVSVPIANSEKHVFDVTVHPTTGVQVKNVTIPGVSDDMKQHFADIAGKSVADGYAASGIKLLAQGEGLLRQKQKSAYRETIDIVSAETNHDHDFI